MTPRFEKAFEKVIIIEGGYVDHKADRGGKTNYGITESTARAYGYTGEMYDLTLEEAKDIYWRGFWSKYFEDIDYDIAEFMFDMNVNHGWGNMSKITQEALNLTLPGSPIVVDGYAGKNTFKAVKDSEPYRLIEFIIAKRYEFYIKIMENNESQEAFGFGWFNRIKKY